MKFSSILVSALVVFGLVACAQPSGGNEEIKYDYSICEVGDFIMKDGSILSKDTETLTDEQKANVAAIIVRAKVDDIPALGIGIIQGSEWWCASNSQVISNSQGDLFKTNCNDGSNSWEIINTRYTDSESAYYSALNYCHNYSTNKGFKGSLTTGWYLPALAELETIYNNREPVGNSLSKAGADSFGSNNFWSCNQNSIEYSKFYTKNLGSGQEWNKYSTESNKVLAIHQFN